MAVDILCQICIAINRNQNIFSPNNLAEPDKLERETDTFLAHGNADTEKMMYCLRWVQTRALSFV